jgi:thymidylate kinase
MRNLTFEGIDHVGKNETALAVTSRLLAQGEKVLFMNFPQYWFFGHFIRKINRLTEVTHLFANVGSYRETELRAAMYAFDRALALAMVETSIDISGDTIIVSDRGPTSNAVTFGYMIGANKISYEEAQQLMNIIPQLDASFINYFKPTSVLLVQQNMSNGGHIERAVLDQYELPPAQEAAARVYAEFNLPQVVTRDFQGWRDLNDISSQALANIGYQVDPQILLPSSVLALNIDNLSIVGPQIFDFAIEKELTIHPDYWMSLSLGSGNERPEKKAILDKFESKIAEEIMAMLLRHRLVLNFGPNGQIAMQSLLTSYPELYEVLIPAMSSLEFTDLLLRAITA